MKQLFQTIQFSFLILAVHCLTIFTSCNTKNENYSLPQFNIDLDTSKVNIGDYIDASISYQSQNRIISIENLPLKIKYRGNASSHHPKKNFSLKLSEKFCFIKSRCHKRWKLNAEYTDKTFMRNKLSYDLFRLFSPNNLAPKINYVTVHQ